ncbi:DUF3581 domain-containing protein [Ectothiorhodospira mobilis]|uniref:DUF3581 domain-containing protein n=1 Tax=Ectothiorhodospira mobilis TaxID=195064 RepID=UPI00190809B1|nr:DUF3581 domain-containing protein [Ectothiorhodospira mobilis]MBK1692121.1 hypothetical protein [Ectothiorhodospira mobilis]
MHHPQHILKETEPVPSYLDEFHSQDHGGVRVSRRQASRFAKEVAGDFNPIHDEDAKRFCVPGDLLFCLVLAHYGVSRRMAFTFQNMVGEDVALCFPETEAPHLAIADAAGKVYLEVEREGETSRDAALVGQLTRDYAAFSGQNFPHVLVPLMKSQGVMVNPQRPLVFYNSMAFEFGQWPVAGAPQLVFSGADLRVNGKRGDVDLNFDLVLDDRVVGRGCKKLVLSGLRPFEQEVMDALVQQYDGWKAAYQAA